MSKVDLKKDMPKLARNPCCRADNLTYVKGYEMEHRLITGKGKKLHTTILKYKCIVCGTSYSTAESFVV